MVDDRGAANSIALWFAAHRKKQTVVSISCLLGMILLAVLSITTLARFPTVAQLQGQSTEISGSLSDYRCELVGKYGKRSRHAFELNLSDRFSLSIRTDTFGCGDFPGPKSSLGKATVMRVNAHGDVLSIVHGGKRYLDIKSSASDKQTDVVEGLIAFSLLFLLLLFGYRKTQMPQNS